MFVRACGIASLGKKGDRGGLTPALGNSAGSTVSCNDGVLLGGGAKLNYTGGNDGTAAVAEVYPSSSTTMTATAERTTKNGNAATVTAYAICSLAS